MLPEIEYYINEQPGGRPSRLHEWDIDLFDFAGKAQNYHLVAGVYQLLEDHGLINKFRLSKHGLLTYLHRIQDGYIAENPYHNSIHALDVSLNVNYFCRQKLMCDLITPLDRLAAIIGAAIHDYQHPGELELPPGDEARLRDHLQRPIDPRVDACRDRVEGATRGRVQLPQEPLKGAVSGVS